MHGFQIDMADMTLWMYEQSTSTNVVSYTVCYDVGIRLSLLGGRIQRVFSQ